MSNGDNGNNKIGEKIDKQCPFLKETCIEGKCSLYTEFMQGGGGLQPRFGVCAFNAVILILSEINQKTQVPQQKFQLPIIRG